MRKHAHVVCLGGLCLVLGSGACGNTDDGGLSGGGGGTPIALDDLPPLYSAAYCSVLESCLGPLFSLYVADDCTTTTTRRLEDGDFNLLKDAVVAKRITYHGENAQACLDAIAGRACDALLERNPQACEDTFVGSVTGGGACEIDEECEGSNVCRIDASCPGTCVPPSVAGGDCQGENDHCASGLNCSNETMKCTTPAQHGDSCHGAADPQCAPNLACAGEDKKAGTAGTCKTPDEVMSGKDGEDCAIVDGVSQLCATGLSCLVDVQPGPPPTLVQKCGSGVGSGAACTIGFPDPCPEDEFCAVPDKATKGTCKPLLAAGTACNADLRQCQAYSVCDTTGSPDPKKGTCKALQRLGGACQNAVECYSQTCTAGACAVPDPCKP